MGSFLLQSSQRCIAHDARIPVSTRWSDRRSFWRAIEIHYPYILCAKANSVLLKSLFTERKKRGRWGIGGVWVANLVLLASSREIPGGLGGLYSGSSLPSSTLVCVCGGGTARTLTAFPWGVRALCGARRRGAARGKGVFSPAVNDTYVLSHCMYTVWIYGRLWAFLLVQNF